MTSRVGTPDRRHIGVGTGQGLRVSTDPRAGVAAYAAHMAREGGWRPAAPVVVAVAGALCKAEVAGEGAVVARKAYALLSGLIRA